MACATASTVSFSAAATTARTSTSRLPTCVHAFARSTVRPAGFRLQHNRAHLAKVVNSGCWGSAGNCGPSMNPRRWSSGPNMQRSFNKWAEQASNNMWFPVDVEETAQQYTFVADVPGLGKNDIKVQVNKDRVLSISGERLKRSKPMNASSSSSSTDNDIIDIGDSESDKAEQSVQRMRQERRFGSFKRTWNLPEDADVSQIKASVDQGVLTLFINRTKPAEPEVTNIPIS